MTANGNNDIAKDLRQTKELNASHNAARRQEVEAQHDALIAQGVPEEDVLSNKLGVRVHQHFLVQRSEATRKSHPSAISKATRNRCPSIAPSTGLHRWATLMMQFSA